MIGVIIFFLFFGKILQGTLATRARTACAYNVYRTITKYARVFLLHKLQHFYKLHLSVKVILAMYNKKGVAFILDNILQRITQKFFCRFSDQIKYHFIVILHCIQNVMKKITSLGKFVVVFRIKINLGQSLLESFYSVFHNTVRGQT